MSDNFIPSPLFIKLSYYIRNNYLLKTTIKNINIQIYILSLCNINDDIQKEINNLYYYNIYIYNIIIYNTIEIKKYSSILHSEYLNYINNIRFLT
jgi:hypothetical protein